MSIKHHIFPQVHLCFCVVHLWLPYASFHFTVPPTNAHIFQRPRKTCSTELWSWGEGKHTMWAPRLLQLSNLGHFTATDPNRNRHPQSRTGRLKELHLQGRTLERRRWAGWELGQKYVWIFTGIPPWCWVGHLEGGTAGAIAEMAAKEMRAARYG